MRRKGDKCDCSRGPHCLCSWSIVRDKFDKIAGPDFNIGPCDLRELLTDLRAPALLDDADFQDCLLALGEGVEDSETPRIKPVPFEKFYVTFFQKYDA